MRLLTILAISLATLIVGCAGTKTTAEDNAACGIDPCAGNPGGNASKKAEACGANAVADACACGADATKAPACGAGDADACGAGDTKAGACGCGPTVAATPKPTVLDQIDEFIKVNTDKSGSEWRMNLPRPPTLPFDANKRYFWNLETTKGTIRIKLMPEVAPMHVSSTIYLTRLGFYDRLIFHRIIPGFMAQGGCPMGNGMEGPGYKYAGEFNKRVRHDSGGILSMANAGPNTDGSQFFLTFVTTPHLDDKHTIFGRVIGAQSFKTLRALEASGQRNGRPIETITIKKATIEIQ